MGYIYLKDLEDFCKLHGWKIIVDETFNEINILENMEDGEEVASVYGYLVIDTKTALFEELDRDTKLLLFNKLWLFAIIDDEEKFLKKGEEL